MGSRRRPWHPQFSSSVESQRLTEDGPTVVQRVPRGPFSVSASSLSLAVFGGTLDFERYPPGGEICGPSQLQIQEAAEVRSLHRLR